ncbi:trigger factor, partial [Staphylococcus saprophyticus]|uniref:trigger factor n=1 Tax=Staphylococcus saprophyticus TaxID=29385 RepID=UPI003703CD32
MTPTSQKNQPNEPLLTLTVPPQKLHKPIHQPFKKLLKQINLPPFPKAKVPPPIFQQPF